MLKSYRNTCLPLLLDQFIILLKSSLPVSRTHLSEYVLLITSILAAGHLGKVELAACTLGSMTANVTPFNRIKLADFRLFGLCCQRMGVLYLFLLVPMLYIWLNAEGILVLLRQDREVARLAGRYLAMAKLSIKLAFGLPAFSFNTIAKQYFQAQGLFTGVNFVLTGLFVYYPRPLPRNLAPYLHLGSGAAPLATAISYNLVALGSVSLGWRIKNKMRPAWHPLSMRALHPTGLGTLLILGPGGVGQAEWWAWELVGLAASLYVCFPFSLGVAMSVRIGQLLGLARPRLAKLAAHAAILLGFALSLIFSIVFWIWRKEWSYLFNNDEGESSLTAKATAGLRGLWTGLTMSLVYCAVLGTILCLMTDWKHEVDRVKARMRAKERRDHWENVGTNASYETTFTDT
ncbi:hypothetical protein C8J55DRAFT_537163 [Lentinula edodes]|uniref:Uncharacterized protein n=1 Tax=Lentinula lateritia TaxID=40482 RepID=A0A9W9DIU9_9AGAR|nr:hypothetical protein C8J55DRAFT_537163 [Lentinula edodes]